MASRLLRRSGVAVALIAELLEWRPTQIVQVGIGRYCKEVEVFKEAWPDAELTGFEPMSFDLSDYPGKVIRRALGRKDSRSRLWYDRRHPDGASLFPPNDDSASESSKVFVDVLDAYCYRFFSAMWSDRRRTLLWLDCEGSELDVLIGGERFVEDVEMINVELTGKPPRTGWPSPVEVNRWLLDRGFLLQFVHTHRSTSGQFDAIYVRPNLFRPEYCSCPLQVEEWEKHRD